MPEFGRRNQDELIKALVFITGDVKGNMDVIMFCFSLSL